MLLNLMCINSRFTFFTKRTLLLSLLFLFFQAIIGSLLLYQLLIVQTKNSLEGTVKRLRGDITFQNNKWDISSYNADSAIPNDGSIYVIASDGFIIERSRPINGLLDLSRYSLIIPYSSPTTIDTITNETWRVLSAPISNNGQTVGVILVAVYKPATEDLLIIDNKLQNAIAQVQPKIYAKGDSIDTSKVDLRKLPFDISFQVVSRFNKVLLQSENSNSVTRVPTFIDRSYINNQLKGDRQKLVKDVITHKQYLTLTAPVYDDKKFVEGIIVVGTSVDFIYSLVSIYALLSFLVYLLLLAIFTSLVNYYINKINNNRSNNELKLHPKVIVFMKDAGKLMIDEYRIDIPYASYQYYFCKSLFSKPHKKWEADELLEIFGEDFGREKWRKVYDTLVALNRKTSYLKDKLFIVKDKRYYINTKFLNLIQAADT